MGKRKREGLVLFLRNGEVRKLECLREREVGKREGFWKKN